MNTLESEPQEPTAVNKKPIYLGWIKESHPDFFKTMNTQVPGLHEKLSNLSEGEIPNLTEAEKNFFIELVMKNTPLIGSIVTGIASKIWGAGGVHWKQEGKHRQENIAAATWWYFCSSRLERERVAELVDFYLGTTKAQAEAEMSNWGNWWRDRTNIKLK